MNHTLLIDNLKPRLPIIQGGMGVGISLHNLAGHVALNGGIGLISTAQIGYKKPFFSTNPLKANCEAMKEEFLLAKAISHSGIIGFNIMVALNHYEEYVQQAVAVGADLIVSGAGLPMTLPAYTKGSSTKIAPIVSSGKAAHIICKFWDKKYQVTPDLIVIEGPLAGGHLGFSTEAILANPNVLDILKDVKDVIHEYELKYNKRIPLVVAGGFFTGEDVSHALKCGADGVQLGTRFVTTYECDAPLSYKQAYIDSCKEDIKIIKSPVGMPGRAITSSLIKHPPGNKCCLYHCIKNCKVTSIPFCISKALIAAVTEDAENALLFCGSNAYKCDKLEHVEALMQEFSLSIQSYI